MTIPGVYAFYNNDEYVCEGTLREISEFTGIGIGGLRNCATPSYQKKFPHRAEKCRWLVKLEDEDGE